MNDVKIEIFSIRFDLFSQEMEEEEEEEEIFLKHFHGGLSLLAMV